MTQQNCNVVHGTQDDDHSGNSLGMPEAVGMTVVIAFATMMAAGWFDLMLPWTG